MGLIEVRVSCPSAAVAGDIGHAAVEAGLAACAHIAPLRSIYRWAGAVHEATEWSLSLRSRADRFDELAKLIRQNHPYELPAITAHACTADRATTAWVTEATS